MYRIINNDIMNYFRWNRTARADAEWHKNQNLGEEDYDNVILLLENYKTETTKKKRKVRL